MFRSIERSIRRALSEYSSIGTKESILVLEAIIPQPWSLPVIRILYKISREYKNRLIYLIYPWFLSTLAKRDQEVFYDELIEIDKDLVSPLIQRCLEDYQEPVERYTCLLKLGLLIGVNEALRRRVKHVLFACPRDSCFRRTLKSILLLDRELLSEAVPRRVFSGVEVVNYLYDVSEEDLLALAVSLKDIYSYNNSLKRFYEETGFSLEQLMEEYFEIQSSLEDIVYSGRRELIYSSTEAVSRLYFERSDVKKCAICSAPIERSRDLCRYCEKLSSFLNSFQKLSR